MKNNANQDIHTGYGIDDVFVPNAANQLARTNHYDFVITQEMVDSYIAEHSSATSLDVGELIKSNADGTTGTWTQAQSVEAPVSIYIAADLSAEDALPLDFAGSLVWTSGSYGGEVVDGRAFFPSGSASRSATDGAINVYAQYGFKVADIAGGFNFWTAMQAPVMVLAASGWNGVVRLGAYSTDDYGIDLDGRTGLHVICERLVEGVGILSSVQASAVTSGYDFPVVYAAWMYGSQGASVSYALPAIGRPGLFQQIQQSVALGTDPILTEYGQLGEITRYHLESIVKRAGALAPDLITYTGNGKVVEIAVDGTVTRRAAAQLGSTVIIRDVDIPWSSGATAPNVPYDVTGGRYDEAAKLTVCEDGAFREIPQPGSGTSATGWDYSYNGPGYAHFDFGGSNRLEWFTWYRYYKAVSSPFDVTNGKRMLYIQADRLVEGVVYEIGISVCALGEGECSCVAAGTMGFAVQFWDEIDTNDATQLYVYQWAETSSGASINEIHPNFRLCVEATDETLSTPAPRYAGRSGTDFGYLEPVLAKASIHFVKIGGKVYVMSY